MIEVTMQEEAVEDLGADEEDNNWKDGGPCGNCGTTKSYKRWRAGKREHEGKPCCTARRCKIELNVEEEKPRQRKRQQAASPAAGATLRPPPNGLPAQQALVALLTQGFDHLAQTFEQSARLAGMVSSSAFVLAALQNAALLAQQRASRVSGGAAAGTTPKVRTRNPESWAVWAQLYP